MMEFTTKNIVDAFSKNNKEYIECFLNKLDDLDETDIEYTSLYKRLIAKKKLTYLTQNVLGDLYYHGLGTEKNYKKAFEYYHLSADKGYTLAQNNLAFMYYLGYNRITTEQNYKKTDNQNCPPALSNLGFIYRNGHGTEYNEPDYQKAYQYFQLAADQGYASAQNNLAYMYHLGQCTKTGLPDYQKAYKYFQLAADQGYVVAQYNIGYIYLRGKGIKKDYPKAMYYFQMAADQGNKRAQKKLNIIFKKHNAMMMLWNDYYKMKQKE